MRLIPVWALRPGMEVARKVYHGESGAPLINTGVKLQMDYIQKLKKLNIRAVYIHDSLIPDVEIEDVILEETREKAINLVRDTMFSIRDSESQKMSGTLALKKELSKVLDDIVGQLLGNKNLTVNLSDIRYTDDYTFSHSVNVAVLSIMTAIAMGCSRRDLESIGLGAFLHDLGKVVVPLNILNKPGRLTETEMQEIRKHPSYGLALIKTRHFFNNQTLSVIYKHHERTNGKGYPEGLAGADIGLFPKICAVTDVYDALVSNRSYRAGFLPHKAMEIMDAECEGYEMEVLQTFYHNISAYPVGTIVSLSCGMVGVVVENKYGFPYKPKVRVFCTRQDFQPVKRYEVDLAESLEIIIDYVFDETEIPHELINSGGSRAV